MRKKNCGILCVDRACAWSKSISRLDLILGDVMQKEIGTDGEKQLYEAAMSVEKDTALGDEMADWEISLQDGLDDELR